jgi:hypothetical protein
LSDNFIYVGDKFLIRPAYTPTSTSPSSTPTRIASLTPSYTPSTKTTSTNSLSTSTIPDISYSSGENDKFLIGIIAITLIISIFAAYMGKTNTGK